MLATKTHVSIRKTQYVNLIQAGLEISFYMFLVDPMKKVFLKRTTLRWSESPNFRDSNCPELSSRDANLKENFSGKEESFKINNPFFLSQRIRLDQKKLYFAIFLAHNFIYVQYNQQNNFFFFIQRRHLVLTFRSSITL